MNYQRRELKRKPTKTQATIDLAVAHCHRSCFCLSTDDLGCTKVNRKKKKTALTFDAEVIIRLLASQTLDGGGDMAHFPQAFLSHVSMNLRNLQHGFN